METPSVANRYARTLFAYAVEEDARDAVRADCGAIRQLIGSSPEFAAFIENPTIPADTARQAMATLFEKEADPVTLRFLAFLASRSRLSLLETICSVYEQLVCGELGLLKVAITAAHELSDAQLAAIKEKLHLQYGKTILAEVAVDASLIGGFKIREGDQIRDFSLLAKLDLFEKSVTNAKHEHPKYKAKSWR